MKRLNLRHCLAHAGKLFGLLCALFLLEQGVNGSYVVTVAVPTERADMIHANVTAGLDALYRGDFERAATLFATQIKNYPDDPKAYFFLALTKRWLTRIEPGSALYQKEFEDAMAKSINLCKSRLEQTPNDPEATLYLGASYGYNAEYYNFLKFDWSRAYHNGVKMRDYLEKASDLPNISVDAQLGYALYNYYAYRYRDKIGRWRFLLSLPKGDREKGIAMLEALRQTGIYSQVEAWYFLIEIYKEEKNSQEQAIALCRTLHETYPNNPFFHTLLAGTYHKFHDWEQSQLMGREIIANAGSPNYSDYLVYQAKYLVGESAFFQGNYQEAAPFFDDIIAARPELPTYLVPWAHLRRGAIYRQTGQKEKAIEEFKLVLKMKDVHHVHDFAEAMLKNQPK